MSQEVRLPDGRTLTFPDGMDPQAMETVLQQYQRDLFPESAPRPEGLREVSPGARLGLDVEAAAPPPRASWQGASLPQSRAELGERLGHVVENVRTVAPYAISGGLSLGGALAGGVMGGPATALLGETAGSMAGREVNKYLGWEEPGTLGDLAALLSPVAGVGVGKAIGAGLRLGKRLVPGLSFGLHEMGAEEARGLTKEGAKLWPKPAADKLYEGIASGPNPTVPLTETAQVAQELLEQQLRMAPGARSAPVVNAAEAWLDMATDPQGLDFRTLWKAQQQLRQHLSTVGTLDDHSRSLLDKAILADFDQLPGAMGAQLRQANQTYKKELANRDLGRFIESAIKPIQGQESERISAQNLITRFEKELATDKNFREAYTAAEIGEIRGTLAAINQYVPPLGQVPGATLGAGGGLGIGGALSYLGADPATSMLTGSAVAVVLPVVLSTSGGRKLVQGLAKAGHLWDDTGVKALSAFGRGAGRAAGQELTEPD